MLSSTHTSSPTPWNIRVPFRTDARGLVAGTAWDPHVRQMIEQVLFTEPGERVNRPDFGCGLLQYVFLPINAELLAATEVRVQTALQRWLAGVIQLAAVDITADEATFSVDVQYQVAEDPTRKSARFEVPRS